MVHGRSLESAEMVIIEDFLPLKGIERGAVRADESQGIPGNVIVAGRDGDAPAGLAPPDCFLQQGVGQTPRSRTSHPEERRAETQAARSMGL